MDEDAELPLQLNPWSFYHKKKKLAAYVGRVFQSVYKPTDDQIAKSLYARQLGEGTHCFSFQSGNVSTKAVRTEVDRSLMKFPYHSNVPFVTIKIFKSGCVHFLQ